jgi:Ca2+-binding EF-hand superfamily protein
VELAISPEWSFARLDRNRDGLLTLQDSIDRRSFELLQDLLRRAGSADGRLSLDGFFRAQRQQVEEKLRLGKKEAYGDPKSLFQQLDTNGDGFLFGDELQPVKRLASDMPRWDLNRDTAIDQREFRGFLEVMSLEEGARLRAPPPVPPAEAPKAAAYRADRLPPGLPPWFTELDKDRDGQIGLYEWKGRPLGDFPVHDRNGDGFITIEEALRTASTRPNPPRP